MKIGDFVICVFPGAAKGPDCIVGNILQIKDIAEERDFLGRFTGNKALVFDCHPYIEGRFIWDSASASRFRLLGEDLDADFSSEIIKKSKIISDIVRV